MKKLLSLLAVVTLLSCEVDDFGVGNGHYGKYWKVVITEDFEEFEPFITAHNGWEAKWGATLRFEAQQIPGYTFVDWTLPSWYSSCMHQPVVDPDNPRIQIVHNPKDRTSPCNSPLEVIVLTPNYIKN